VTVVANLVLGDDHIVFLDVLSTVLTQHGYTVDAVASSAAEMVASVRRERPDACLIDRHVVRAEDADIIGRVLAASSSTTVLVLSADQGADAARRALAAGASGYVHQSRGIDALVSALERVLNGEVVVDVPEAAPARGPVPANVPQRLAAQLTARERECLLMLVEGLDTGAMVERLGVSRTTVRTHLQAVLTKLGVHSRLEAASFAVRHRLPDIWSEDVPAAAASKVREIRSRQAAGRSASRGSGPVTGSGSATGRVGGSAAAHAARATRHLFPAAGQDAGTG
jgi:two-component system nitrate/nitrite response regulator NarL